MKDKPNNGPRVKFGSLPILTNKALLEHSYICLLRHLSWPLGVLAAARTLGVTKLKLFIPGLLQKTFAYSDFWSWFCFYFCLLCNLLAFPYLTLPLLYLLCKSWVILPYFLKEVSSVFLKTELQRERWKEKNLSFIHWFILQIPREGPGVIQGPGMAFLWELL